MTEQTGSVQITVHDENTVTVVFDRVPGEALEEWLSESAKEQMLSGIKAEMARRREAAE